MTTDRWTVRGRTALVTGATSGHGLAVAEALAREGAAVVLLGRHEERLRAARERVAAAGGPPPETLRCDLAAGAEIDRLAEQWLASGRPLHLLVNNAGLVSRHRRESPDGLEINLAVNALAPYRLTLRLLPRLRRSAPSRVVFVASDAHRIGRVDLDDPGYARGGYGFMRAYARSKRILLHLHHELHHRLEGTGVTTSAVDPGPVASGIADGNPGWLAPAAAFLIRRWFPAPERAARDAVRLCLEEDGAASAGRYLRFGAFKEPDLGTDPGRSLLVWRMAARLTGVDYVPPPGSAGTAYRSR